MEVADASACSQDQLPLMLSILCAIAFDRGSLCPEVGQATHTSSNEYHEVTGFDHAQGQTIPESQVNTLPGYAALLNAMAGLNGPNGTTVQSPTGTTVIPGPSITRDVGRRLDEVRALPCYSNWQPAAR